MVKTKSSIEIASMKAGMDAKTTRKYCKRGKLPSELKQKHDWQTRKIKWIPLSRLIFTFFKLHFQVKFTAIFSFFYPPFSIKLLHLFLYN